MAQSKKRGIRSWPSKTKRAPAPQPSKEDQAPAENPVLAIPRDTPSVPTTCAPPMPEEIPGATADDFAQMYTYTHLLKNLWTEREERERKEKANAPKIAGWREAAVLARLWADADLKLAPTSQGDMAVDLGMQPGEMTGHLNKFRVPRDGGEPLVVEERKGNNRREIFHKITEAGKRELRKWVLAHYSTEALLKYVTQISPDRKKICKLIDLQRKDVMNALGLGTQSASVTPVAADDR